MAHKLQSLLANDHPLFLMNIARLERASGFSGIDVRLIAEIAQRSYGLAGRLGFRGTDILGPEFYHALNAAINRGDESLFDDSEYLLINFGDGPISLSLADVQENIEKGLDYDHRSVAHAQRRLRAEIVKRYAEHERTNSEMVRAVASEINLINEEESLEKATEPAQNNSGDGSKKPVIYAIGDIFTDAFIKLYKDEAKVETDKDGKKWLSVPFGAKPPYEQVDVVRAVGPAPNAAVSFAKLGLTSTLLTFLGDDEPGRDSIAQLRRNGVDVNNITVAKRTASNYYYVLRYGAERTILVKNQDYNYQFKKPDKTPNWIYLGLISDKSWKLHEELLDYLEKNPEINFALQPGTFHFKWGSEKMAPFYKRAKIVVMNLEEAAEVTELKIDNVRAIAEKLAEMGPEIAIITNGTKGSVAYTDGKLYKVPNYPDFIKPVDRTGAGDAFASAVVGALALGIPLEEALLWGPINSANVVTKLGAQAGLLSAEDIKSYIASAPEWYKIEEKK